MGIALFEGFRIFETVGLTDSKFAGADGFGPHNAVAGLFPVRRGEGNAEIDPAV
jgi:hypothetical protein